MLQPRKTKFRKQQKGRMKGLAHRGHTLSNGQFGIKSLDSAFITARQIEAARIAATRFMKREGTLWIKIFPSSCKTRTRNVRIRGGSRTSCKRGFASCSSKTTC